LVGLRVVEAADGEAAVRRVRDQDFDVVITDLRMPGSSGLDLLREVRGLPDPPEVVVLTAHGSVTTAVEAIKAGAFDFLEKPLDRDRTLITVRNAVHQASLLSRVAQSGESFLTESKIMREVLDEARRRAATPPRR
jgi:DNA-binding NtrC family response regulator